MIQAISNNCFQLKKVVEECVHSVAFKIVAGLMAGSFAFWMGSGLFVSCLIGGIAFLTISMVSKALKFKALADFQSRQDFIPDIETMKKPLVKFKERPSVFDWLERPPAELSAELSDFPAPVVKIVSQYAAELNPQDARKFWHSCESIGRYNGDEILKFCDRLDQFQKDPTINVSIFFFTKVKVKMFSIWWFNEQMKTLDFPALISFILQPDIIRCLGSEETPQKIKAFFEKLKLDEKEVEISFDNVVWLPNTSMAQSGKVMDDRSLGVVPRTRALQYMKAGQLWYESSSVYQKDIP